MAQKIASVGFEIPGDDASHISFYSDCSLLDYDIAIIDPCIEERLTGGDVYLNKHCLSDSESFRLKEQLLHWAQEIVAAMRAGKTVVVLLNSLQEVFIATGEKTHSGTGRNRQTTRQVDSCRNYDFLPTRIEVRSSTGSSMRLVGKDNVLSAYWTDFGKESEYRVLVEVDKATRLICTRTGNEVVGVRNRFENMAGTLYLLPYLDFQRKGHVFQKDGKDFWTDDGVAFGKRFVKAIVELDRITRQSSEITPMPTWLSSTNDYTLPAEAKLNRDLLNIESEIEALITTKTEVLDAISNETILNRLLYEKGTPLEKAIIEALKLLGFAASRYRDNDSEFDVVFVCDEGRLLGEAEGRDAKAINITKLRQLEMNILEDFEREEVNEPAKGVLFGNACRLTHPNDRGDFFTEKCQKAADRSQTALVRTPDLFAVARHLSGNNDKRFAKRCRSAILKAVGIVQFPETPKPKAIASANIASH